MILYENTVGHFLESCLNKKMVPYLIEEYESHYGKSLPIVYTKDQICIYEIMVFIINNNVNKDCGIRIDFINNERNSRLAFIFASKDGNNINIGLVDMFPFNSIKPTNDRNIVLVNNNISRDEFSIIHPFIQSLAYIKYISKNDSNENCDYYVTPFLYECLNEDGFVPNDKENDNMFFYAGDYDRIEDALGNVIKYGNGIEALKYLHSKDKLPFDYKENINNFYELIGYQLYEDYKANKNVLYLVKEYSDIELNKKNKDYIKEHDITVIKNEFSYDKVKKNGITIYSYLDLNDKDKQDIIKYASNNNLIIREYDANAYLNFEEGINGLARIIEKTDDGSLASLYRISNYDVVIVSSEDELLDKPGYSKITIPNDVYYDKEKEIVVKGNVLYKAFVNSFTNGDEGAYVFVADEGLREFLKKEIEESDTELQNLVRITEIVKNGGDINNIISSINGRTKDNAQQKVISDLGDACWDKMFDESKTSLISGLLVLEGLKRCDKTADFSGSCLQICKAVEYELTDRYITKYLEYLKEKYGDEALDKAPYSLLKEQKDKTAPKEFINPSYATLGDFRFIMGLYQNGEVANKYAWNKFEEYAKDKLLKDTTNPLATMGEHVTYIMKIKNDYRNKSAHKEFMDITQGNDCYNYIVGKLKRLSIILDSYKY